VGTSGGGAEKRGGGGEDLGETIKVTGLKRLVPFLPPIGTLFSSRVRIAKKDSQNHPYLHGELSRTRNVQKEGRGQRDGKTHYQKGWD